MPAVAKLPESRTYNRLECITFRKTAEKFGGLSNMAGGYLLNVNGVKILTSEALYQACRFPHLPEVQRLIIAERSPMTAKMKSKPYRDNSRVDWDIVRTKVMRWCLQVKLVQNWEKFSELLLETGDLPIVEDSRKDDFWGAKPEDEEILTGANVLGRLLMQVREQIKTGEITSETIVKPLPIQNFLLYGQEISSVSANSEYHLDNYRDLLDFNKVNNQPDSEVVLPDTPMLESDFNGKNTINSHVSAESIESEHQKYD
ncbi:MAG: NADAR family protein, partial [Pseudanabaena sp.]